MIELESDNQTGASRTPYVHEHNNSIDHLTALVIPPAPYLLDMLISGGESRFRAPFHLEFTRIFCKRTLDALLIHVITPIDSG